jgi:hypothetical protein
MPDPMMPARFQDIDESFDVARHIGLRIDQRVADARLRRQVDDDLELLAGVQLAEPGAIGQIHAHEAKSLNPLELAQARLLQRDIVVVIQIVEANDRPPLLQQPAGQVKTDETRHADDQDRHVRCFVALRRRLRIGSQPLGGRRRP